MSRLLFTEYGSDTGPLQLHVLIRTAAEKDLRQRLRGLMGCVGVDLVGDDMMAVRAAPNENTDDFLQRTARLVDLAGARIVEARLCTSNSTACEQVEISSRFTVLAADTAGDLKPAHSCLFLEPGTSFGSGRHPSTRLAVQALQELADQGGLMRARVLDIGCGSGVLDLVCARLGATSVLGLDISPEAVAAARKNILLNEEKEKVAIEDWPLSKIDQRFDILVANISPFILQGQVVPFLPRLLAPHGHIVLAGMREAQFGGLRRSLREVGLQGREQFYEEGLWRGLWLDTGKLNSGQNGFVP